jgi:hypothetical protein
MRKLDFLDYYFSRMRSGPKALWIFLLSGLILIIGGIILWVHLSLEVKEFRNYGVATRAEIFRYDIYKRSSDYNSREIYEITYIFQAPSPLDGYVYDYLDRQEVSKGFFDSLIGCRDIDDVYVKLNCELDNPDKSTISQHLCDGKGLDFIYSNVVNCEEVSIIYNSKNPRKSWILGNEPKSGWGGIVMMIFGFSLLILYSYLIMVQRRNN